jgi:hypothetical protein
MKNIFWFVGGTCAAIAGIIVWQRSHPTVPELAHRLEDAWADHHTVA